jgi:hypothetical protein
MGACREFHEEIGDLPPMQFMKRFAARMQDGSTYTTFVCAVTANVAQRWCPTLNWENDHAGWFTRLPSPMHPDAYDAIMRI